MKILMPGFSCVVPSGFENDPENEVALAISQGYCRIYIETAMGLLLHQNLSPGKDGANRYVRLPCAALPDGKKPLNIGPSINFLPDGKVPIELLLQIQAFFKGVMARHKQKLEAMIWIVWNQEQGYHLLVPKQTVGAASARYEWGDIPEGTIVVVDIHSHADMGAFFSGTDNNDDSNSVRYSGVIGHNSRAVPEMLFRFNFLGKFIDQKADDIFCAPQPVVEEPPADWYDQISLYTTTSYANGWSGQQGGYRGHIAGGAPQGYPFHGSRTMDGEPRRQGRHLMVPADDDGGEGEGWFTQYGTGQPASGPAAGNTGQSSGFGSVRETTSGLVTAVENGSKATGLRRVPGPKGVALDKVEGRVFTANNGMFFTDGKDMLLPFNRATGRLLEFPGTEVVVLTPEEMEERIMAEDKEAAKLLDPAAPSVPDELDEDAVQAAVEAEQERNLMEQAAHREAQEELLAGAPEGGENHINEDPRFDALAINYGVEAATAFLLIEELAPNLANTEGPLRDTIAWMFELVEEDDRLAVFRNLAESLTERDKANLAQNGL